MNSQHEFREELVRRVSREITASYEGVAIQAWVARQANTTVDNFMRCTEDKYSLLVAKVAMTIVRDLSNTIGNITQLVETVAFDKFEGTVEPAQSVGRIRDDRTKIDPEPGDPFAEPDKVDLAERIRARRDRTKLDDPVIEL